MALATIDFRVNDVNKYLEWKKHISASFENGQWVVDPNLVKYRDWLNTYQLHIINEHRVSNTRRFVSLIKFNNLNLFVESMLYYRQHFNDPEVIGDPDAKFHIIDPDYQEYVSKSSGLIELIEYLLTRIVDLHDAEKDLSKLVKKIMTLLETDEERESLASHYTQRTAFIKDTLSRCQETLSGLRYGDITKTELIN